MTIDRLLDARPAWVTRAHARARARWEHDPRRRRLALTGALIVWQLGDLLLPRRQLPAVRRLLVVLIVFDSVATWVWVRYGIAVEGNPLVATVMARLGDGLGLAVRALWSIVLVVGLCFIAQRRAVVRPAVALVVVAFGGVTLLHVSELAWAWTILLG